MANLQGRVGRNVCFTCNNYTEEHVNLCRSLVDNGLTKIIRGRRCRIECDYIIFGFEEAPTTGTPHLQGFMRVKTRILRIKMIEMMPGFNFTFDVRGTVAENIAYCSKGGEFEQYGSPGRGVGERLDLLSFKEAVISGHVTNEKDIIEHHSALYARCAGFCMKYLQYFGKKPVFAIDDHPLRQWQAELYEKLCGPINNREIIFLVDLVGNSGKSWFFRYYYRLHQDNSQIILPGQSRDLSLIVNPEARVLMMDVARSTAQKEFLNYAFLENLKDGYIISPKYNSRMVQLSPMHLVIALNQMPDMDALSHDRYTIIRINENNCVLADDNLQNIVRFLQDETVVEEEVAALDRLDTPTENPSFEVDLEEHESDEEVIAYERSSLVESLEGEELDGTSGF
jgi:hypothetical protein